MLTRSKSGSLPPIPTRFHDDRHGSGDDTGEDDDDDDMLGLVVPATTMLRAASSTGTFRRVSVSPTHPLLFPTSASAYDPKIPTGEDDMDWEVSDGEEEENCKHHNDPMMPPLTLLRGTTSWFSSTMAATMTYDDTDGVIDGGSRMVTTPTGSSGHRNLGQHHLGKTHPTVSPSPYEFEDFVDPFRMEEEECEEDDEEEEDSSGKLVVVKAAKVPHNEKDEEFHMDNLDDFEPLHVDDHHATDMEHIDIQMMTPMSSKKDRIKTKKTSEST